MSSCLPSHYSALLITIFQPFRFVERPAFRGFVSYVNPKITDTDIPRKTAIASAIDTKVACLENTTINIINVRIDTLHFILLTNVV
jgi:hypothetical protein